MAEMPERIWAEPDLDQYAPSPTFGEYDFAGGEWASSPEGFGPKAKIYVTADLIAEMLPYVEMVAAAPFDLDRAPSIPDSEEVFIHITAGHVRAARALLARIKGEANG